MASVAPLLLRQRNRTLVHIASAWPQDEAGWTQIDGWGTNARFGMCNDVGSAVVYTPSGVLMRPGFNVTKLVKSSALGGKYVRISTQDDSGTIVDGDDGEKFSELWTGIIGGRKILPDRSSGAFTNAYRCAGILAALDSVIPKYHFSVASTGDIAADIGQSPIFNYLGSKKTGNRSVDRYDFGDGVSAYVFERSKLAAFWTAADVVEYYLALFHYFGGGGLQFSVGGQVDALAYSEKWDLTEVSCGEAVSRVASQKQGIGYRCANSVDGVPVITFKSLSKTAVSVPSTAFSSAYTLPANDEQIIADLTLDTIIQDFDLDENTTSQADELAIKLARPWYALTLSLFDAFQFDWTDADELAWETYDPLDTAGTLNTNWGIARVWRRFKLKPSWDGSFVNAAGVGAAGFQMPTNRSSTTDGLHGASGMDGTSNALGGALAPAQMLFMTSELPCLDGYDWSSVDPATVDKTRKNASMLAFMENAPGGSWTTLGQQCEPSMLTVGMEIDSDLAAITFDAAAMTALRSAFEEGLKVYVTVGVMGQFNDTVSWRRATAERARDQSRISSKSRPTLMRKIIPAGTAVGVTPAGVLQYPAADVSIHDDIPLANNILAISRPWYENSDWTISYSKIGDIDQSYAQPCNMLIEVDHLEGDASTTEEDVLGIVTSVEFLLDDPGTTKVTTRRIPIDVQAVL